MVELHHGITQADAMMPLMRTTVRLDDELPEQFKVQARRGNASLTRILTAP